MKTTGFSIIDEPNNEAEILIDFCGEDFLLYTTRNKPMRAGQIRKIKSIKIELE